MEESFIFKPVFARRIPDPNFAKEHNAEKHIFLMRCADMPVGIGNDPNARSPNLNKMVYKDVAKSLLQTDSSEPGTFHLKNKGITIIADSVKGNEGDTYKVFIETGLHGIVDGGHTYEIITENKSDIPAEQFVQVEIRTGIPQSWIPDISGGLNTAVQVQDISLYNLEGRLNWMKDVLKDKKKHIAWSENEDGDLTARDLVTLLCLFNVAVYPNNESKHPVPAYVSPKTALKTYRDNQKAFEAMKPILMDILELYQLIAASARDIWNEEKGAKGGRLTIIEGPRKKRKFSFPFAEKPDSEYRLWKPVLYPMLAAFRRFVKRDETGDLMMRWQVDFPEVKKFWETNGRELLKIAYDTSDDLKGNLNAVGKNTSYWITLHSHVGIKAIESGLIKP